MSKWCYTLIPLCLILFSGLHPFLALRRPVEAQVMVIEGWIPRRALVHAVAAFHAGDYRWMVTNGGQITSIASQQSYGTYARKARQALIGMGIAAQKIIPVAGNHGSNGSKTYRNAKATVDWLRQHKADIKAINIFTLDAHARKSYLLYQKAAQGRLQVGIVPIPPVDYSPDLWFLSIYGIGYVLKNMVGYLYALVL